MSPDEVTRIMVGNISVGIMGLKITLERVSHSYSTGSDTEIINALLSEVEKSNYIVETSRQEYGRALLREYKKFMGYPVKDEVAEGIQIKVLGHGCPQCNRLEQELMEAMIETGIMADMEHVRDPKEIFKYGVMGTPALVINGKIRCVGSVPPKSKLIEWLKNG